MDIQLPQWSLKFCSSRSTVEGREQEPQGVRTIFSFEKWSAHTTWEATGNYKNNNWIFSIVIYSVDNVFTGYFTASDHPIGFSLDPKLENSNYSCIIKSGINLVALNLLGYSLMHEGQKKAALSGTVYIHLLFVVSFFLIAWLQAYNSLWQVLYKQDKVQKNDQKRNHMCFQVKRQNKDIEWKLVNW